MVIHRGAPPATLKRYATTHPAVTRPLNLGSGQLRIVSDLAMRFRGVFRKEAGKHSATSPRAQIPDNVKLEADSSLLRSYRALRYRPGPKRLWALPARQRGSQPARAYTDQACQAGVPQAGRDLFCRPRTDQVTSIARELQAKAGWIALRRARRHHLREFV